MGVVDVQEHRDGIADVTMVTIKGVRGGTPWRMTLRAFLEAYRKAAM